jgi:hypothetical protein
MTSIATVFAITILCIFGLHVAMMPNMVFTRLRAFLDRKITNEYYRKPLYACPKCMSSVWGSLGFLHLLSIGLPIHGLYIAIYWIIWIFALTGAIHLIMEYRPKEFEI